MTWLTDWLRAGGTGGLNWHVHARQSLPHWRPTLTGIADFLAGTEPRASTLLLLGGSAGWMMPTAWLQQFTHIEAYDIDPLAPWLFGWRHGRALRAAGVHVRHHRRDVMAALPEVLAAHPQACVWFDNMLGQHRYRVRDEVRTEAELQALAPALAGRSWGSLHDVYSGPARAPLDDAHYARVVQRGVPASDAHTRQAWLLTQADAHGVWNDHGTSGVFPAATPCWLLPWAFRPGHWHWLQAGWVHPAQE